MHLVYHNLIVWYSLDPVLVIWYVILIIFCEFNVIYLNLKSKFWYAKFRSCNFGKTDVLVILVIIYVKLCDCLSSPRPGGNNLHLYVNLYLYLCNCILFCIFSCIYWDRKNLTNLIAFWLYMCSFVYINSELFNTY